VGRSPDHPQVRLKITLGIFEQCNPAMTCGLAGPHKILHYALPRSCSPPDDLEKTRCQAFPRLARTTSLFFRFVNRNRHRNGAYRWLFVGFQCLNDGKIYEQPHETSLRKWRGKPS